MTTVEAILKFLGTYPTWAKVAMLASLVCTFGVALLAPRTPIDAEASPKLNARPSTTSSSAVLRIHGVTGFSLPPDASVRVTAIVNGKAYLYPSLAGVDWLAVAPTMSPQTFALPPAQQYHVRFEMELNSSRPYSPKRLVSQETAQVSSVPYTDDYRLYPTKADGGVGTIRAGTPGAIVRYSIESAQ